MDESRLSNQNREVRRERTWNQPANIRRNGTWVSPSILARSLLQALAGINISCGADKASLDVPSIFGVVSAMWRLLRDKHLGVDTGLGQDANIKGGFTTSFLTDKESIRVSRASKGKEMAKEYTV